MENPEVILVTIAYRVGVLGFFHLSHLVDGEDYPDAQNLGLLDQMMALKWVHENSKLNGQMLFIAPQIRLAEELAKAGNKSYTFYFTVESSVPIMKAGHDQRKLHVSRALIAFNSERIDQALCYYCKGWRIRRKRIVRRRWMRPGNAAGVV